MTEKKERKPLVRGKPASQAEPSGLYGELVKAAGSVVKPFEPRKVGEGFAEFAQRLCIALNDIPDGDFDKLSKLGKDWFNATGEAVNAKKFDAIPALEGFPEDAPAAAAAEAPKAEAKDQSIQGKETNVTKAKAKGKGAAKTAKAKKPDGVKKPSTDSATYKICAAVVGDPKIEFEAVCKKIGMKVPKTGSFQYLVYNVARKTLEIKAGK